MMNIILLTLHDYEEMNSYRDEAKVRNISLCSFSCCPRVIMENVLVFLEKLEVEIS